MGVRPRRGGAGQPGSALCPSPRDGEGQGGVRRAGSGSGSPARPACSGTAQARSPRAGGAALPLRFQASGQAVRNPLLSPSCQPQVGDRHGGPLPPCAGGPGGEGAVLGSQWGLLGRTTPVEPLPQSLTPGATELRVQEPPGSQRALPAHGPATHSQACTMPVASRALQKAARGGLGRRLGVGRRARREAAVTLGPGL